MTSRKNPNIKVQPEPESDHINDQYLYGKHWTYAFYAVALIILGTLIFTATKVGVTGDEFLDQRHGEFCLKYYTEHDTTFAD